jgi:hypothetical protein
MVVVLPLTAQHRRRRGLSSFFSSIERPTLYLNCGIMIKLDKLFAANSGFVALVDTSVADPEDF